jgi:hypothetical protein
LDLVLDCDYDWQIQIDVEASDAKMPGAVVHETKGLDIEELDAMEHDKGLHTMESDAGPEVLCHNLLVWALLS